jgi:hypothetical protein
VVALLTTDIIVVRESKSGKRTIDVADGPAHPLTVGGRYVMFLGPPTEGGLRTTAPEPWRFRVTDAVRPESAWAPADWLFVPQSLEEFTAAIRRAL